VSDKDVDQVRREVAAEYHRVMIDLSMTGTADLPIVKDGKDMVRRFIIGEDKIITFKDVEVDGGAEIDLGDDLQN
jgi:hypothetical protein